MQNLQPGTTLQSGKYRILSTLGHGGFGITYLAEHTLFDYKVTIKEFFMSDLCGRDGSTGHVITGTGGSRATVDSYRAKFLKEARNLFRLHHPHIVGIIDVFEENDTAYYVMEYCQGGSLGDRLKSQGRMAEPVATRYIVQVASALDYIHQHRMTHLDVKPANIMLNDRDEAVLIDFGLSKQYTADGQQTSTTPVDMSEGYAPLEQYSDIREFSPTTDIYALGATYYALLTGCTPPKAMVVNESGLATDRLKSCGVSQRAIDVIVGAMQPRRRDRIQTVALFVAALKGEAAAQGQQASGSASGSAAHGTAYRPADGRPVGEDSDNTRRRGSYRPHGSSAAQTEPADEPKPAGQQEAYQGEVNLLIGIAVVIAIVAFIAIIVNGIIP